VAAQPAPEGSSVEVVQGSAAAGAEGEGNSERGQDDCAFASFWLLRLLPVQPLAISIHATLRAFNFG
jgi:hypothetical protein